MLKGKNISLRLVNIKDANFINVMNKNGDYLPIKNGLKLCLDKNNDVKSILKYI